MKKRLLLTFLSVLSIIPTIRGQEIGANFNESISEPLKQVNLLKKSGVTWVRGFGFLFGASKVKVAFR